jgi:hypothetical protein
MKPICFNNHLLFWQGHKRENEKYINRSKEEKYIDEDDVSEESDVETYKNRNHNERRKKNNKHYNNPKRNQIESEEAQPQMHSLLQKILKRLEKLETQQSQTVLANRS